jgi:predicted DCC family thiol-disulfide oxidoreductase YuxK
LKRRLLGREQNQRRAFRRCRQGGTDFRETAKRLAAAGRTEEKAHLHGLLFAQRRLIAKQFIVKNWQRLVGRWLYFLFLFGKVVLLFLPVGKIPVG